MKFLKKLFDENYCEVKMKGRESMEEIKFKYGNRIYLLKIQEFNITITDKKITFNFSRNRDAVDLIKDFLSM